MSSLVETQEPQLSIQAFHQCSSLVSAKLNSNNYLLWRSRIIPLVRSLGILHHIHSDEKPSAELENDKGDTVVNPNYSPWIVNDGLLLSWLLGTMREDTLGLNLDAETVYELWSSLEEHLLPVTIEKEGHLKHLLMTLKKGSQAVDEYLREFKAICDMLAAIKKPVSDIDKVFQFARGLGPRYENFRLAMLSKPPYPSFGQFVLALQGHEQALAAQKEEEKVFLEHAQAYFSQRGRGQNGRGGRGQFNSKGRGFTPAGRYNPQDRRNNNQKQMGHFNHSQAKDKNQIGQSTQLSNNSNNNEREPCQICGRSNHVAIDC